MSMLGITLLDEQLGGGRLNAHGKIQDNLRSKVKKMIAQKGKAEEQKDGMDMAIAIIDKEKKELQFAGAHNPLYLIRDSSQLTVSEAELEASMVSNGSHLFELKGDKQPIGVHWEEKKFTNHRVRLVENDTLYLFSDGFVDQFGGEQCKKYKSKRFKELLLSFQKESMDKQKQLLEDALENWRGDMDQIDDVCIIGLRMSTPGKIQLPS